MQHYGLRRRVHVGDTVCCYTDVKRIGRTSITLDVEVWVLRQGQGARVKVTDAEFTFVAVHEDGRPRELASASSKGRRRPVRDVRRTSRQTKGQIAAKGEISAMPAGLTVR